MHLLNFKVNSKRISDGQGLVGKKRGPGGAQQRIWAAEQFCARNCGHMALRICPNPESDRHQE